jgi:flagellar hook-associated protein 3 FlgL
MRISTNTFYDVGIANLQLQNSRLVQVQQQIGAGRRILTPADDPSGSAQVLQVSQSQATNQQFADNMGAAGSTLSLEESVLASIADVLQSAKDAANSAGNGAYNASDRQNLASELRGQYQELLGLANSTDSNGQYLFAGYQSATRPFSQAAPGVVAYNGDQGQRLMQVGPTRQIEVSDSGEALFRRIPAGNGNFVTQTAGANTGTGVIDSGNTLDAMKWNDPANSRDFTIKFAVSAGATTYDIIDNVSGNSLLTGLAPAAAPYPRTYTSGSAIDLSQAGPPAFDFGAQVTISGAPANGDSFTLAPSTSQDVFKTINDLATLLETGPSPTALTNGLTRLQRNLDNALSNVISARSTVGTRLKEIDGLKSANDSLGLLYSQNMSQLQDLDYAKAASELTQQQVNLQAAQQSFVKVAGLSLFNYI